MTGTLRGTIQQLAADFAAGVLGVIRGASLEDILAETEPVRRGRGRPPSQSVAERVPARPSRAASRGRLPRRSMSDIGEVVDQIVGLLSKAPSGLRSEQIRAALGLSSKELPRPIAQALASKRISKSGQKRATTYVVRGGGEAASSGKPAGAKRSSGRKEPSRGVRETSAAKAASRGAEPVADGAAETT